jgi:hypothetical protein
MSTLLKSLAQRLHISKLDQVIVNVIGKYTWLTYANLVKFT